MESIQTIHLKAIETAKHFHWSEGRVLEVVIQVDDRKVYRELGFPSLFAYLTQVMKFSESVAYQFISVARKSKIVPELKKAIDSGDLSVPKAKRIVSVINSENQELWITRAKELTQNKLEKEIVALNPESKIKDRIKPVCKDRLELKVGISAELEKKLNRIKDLLSQKTKKAATLEDALNVMAETYLNKFDPIEKAQRCVRTKEEETKTPTQPKKSKRAPIPANIQHQVNLRDRGQCTHVDPDGKRCLQQRWLSTHHIKPVSQGGENSLANLTTVCSNHHWFAHHKETSAQQSLL